MEGGIKVKYTYIDGLAAFGVGCAHPGGLALTKEILSEEGIEKETIILDSGCGTGQTSAYLSETYNCHVEAIDSNKTMVLKANQRFSSLQLPIKAIVGRTESTPFNDNTFDIVLAESVIMFTNIPLTISEFRRVLKPNGKLIAIEMAIEKSLSKWEQEEIMGFYNFSRLLTEEEWYKEFQRTGFENIQILKHDSTNTENGIENASDFQVSEHLDCEHYNIIEKHQNLVLKYQGALGFRVFKCK